MRTTSEERRRGCWKCRAENTRLEIDDL